MSEWCPWLFELFHLYTVTLKFSFSTYELVVWVVECRWYVWMFQLRFKGSCLCCVLITCSYHYLLWIKDMVVCVVWKLLLSFEWKWFFSCSEQGFFFVLGKYKSRLLALCSHHHVTFLFWMDRIWLTCVTEKLNQTKQIRCYD